MVDIKKRISEVFKKGYLMSLGTVDDKGVWVADVIYIHDSDFNIYWMSKTFVRHSKAIDEENNKVAGTITVNDKKDELALQLEGRAEKIEGARLSLASKILKKRGLEVLRHPKEVLKKDYSWYKLTPTKICLIDEENFGRERKEMDL